MLSFFVQCSILAEFFGEEILGLEAEIIVVKLLCSSAGSGCFVIQNDYFLPWKWDLGILLFGVIISFLENMGAK